MSPLECGEADTSTEELFLQYSRFNLPLTLSHYYYASSLSLFVVVVFILLSNFQQSSCSAHSDKTEFAIAGLMLSCLSTGTNNCLEILVFEDTPETKNSVER